MPHSKRILVVEDNEDLALLLTEVLAEQGHHVRMALDGVSALDIATEFHAELAILDLNLPGINGLDLARRLSVLRPGQPAPRLFALSGFDDLSDREQARDAGFEKYFVKPFLPEDVQTAIDELEESPS